MDRHLTLNKELNDSCDKSALLSWTKHVNQRGTVYTIRFEDRSAMFDSKDPGYFNAAKRVTYKPKSRYHLNRDYLRMHEFNYTNTHARPHQKCDFDNSNSDFQSPISETALNVNNQLHNQHSTLMATTQLTTPRTNELSQALNTNCRPQISSVDKILKPPALILDSPLVQCESIDFVTSIVYHTADISLPPPVEFESAECVSLPEFRQSTENVLPPLLTPVFECKENSNETLDHCISFESQCSRDHDFSYVSYSDTDSPIRDMVKKQLTSKDILCDSCSGTVPNGTNMLYCDVCFLHLCGNCVLSNSYSHSTTCDNKLRYMKETERHLQYVPDSDNSTVSDCTRPPETAIQIDLDQEVPTDPIKKTQFFTDCLNMLIDVKSERKKFRESIYRRLESN